jgi:hypothetical protein
LESLTSLTLLYHTNLLPHFLHKLLHPMFNYAYIDTFIPLHCLHAALNVNGKNFFPIEELDNGTLFEPNILTTFHFDWH